VDGIHFVNTGSIGRPKDGDWRAVYVLVAFGLAEAEIEFIRIPYDIDETIDAIRKSDLAGEFAEQLRAAGAPAVETKS
jgi:diadenosine tetraphosphatase ApaH/serine/threonine PP2A family protein phosphatase